jgi:hypothetical protein
MTMICNLIPSGRPFRKFLIDFFLKDPTAMANTDYPAEFMVEVVARVQTAPGNWRCGDRLGLIRNVEEYYVAQRP